MKSNINHNGTPETSDHRMKSKIQLIDKDAALDFIMNTEPRTSELKEDGNKQIGYIAQELRTSIFGELEFKSNNFPAESSDDNDNVILAAQYERICCILHKGLQDALKRISVLEDRILQKKYYVDNTDSELDNESFRYF